MLTAGPPQRLVFREGGEHGLVESGLDGCRRGCWFLCAHGSSVLPLPQLLPKLLPPLPLQLLALLSRHGGLSLAPSRRLPLGLGERLLLRLPLPDGRWLLVREGPGPGLVEGVLDVEVLALVLAQEARREAVPAQEIAALVEADCPRRRSSSAMTSVDPSHS